MSDELASNWKKAQVLSTILASVLIPLVIAFLGHSVNQSIKNNELSLKYVQLAAGILQDEPKPGTENLRSWAIDVINNYSDVKLSTDAKKELKETPLPQIESVDRNPLSERADYLRKHQVLSDLMTSNDIFRIKKHILLDKFGNPVSIVETPNISGKVLEHKLIIIHFSGSDSSPEATLSYITDARLRASIHLFIDREGRVTQLVPFDYVSWHAGRGQWKDYSRLNNYSISISFLNAGKLEKRDNEWITFYGKPIPESEVYVHKDSISGESTGWHKYTEEQIKTAKEVIPAIVKAYPTIETVLGLSDVKAEIKNEPGPAFPMAEIQRIVHEMRVH